MERRITSNLSDDELILIKINKNWIYQNVAWESDKEFVLEGKMYNIVKKIAKGDYFYCYCINDTKEELLLAHLDEHVNNNLNKPGKSNKTSKNIIKNMIKDLFFNSTTLSLNYSGKDFSFSFLKTKIEHIFYNVTSPPPKFISA